MQTQSGVVCEEIFYICKQKNALLSSVDVNSLCDGDKRLHLVPLAFVIFN